MEEQRQSQQQLQQQQQQWATPQQQPLVPQQETSTDRKEDDAGVPSVPVSHPVDETLPSHPVPITSTPPPPLTANDAEEARNDALVIPPTVRKLPQEGGNGEDTEMPPAPHHGTDS